MGIRPAVPLLTCTMPEDLVDDKWFPMEAAEVLKWFCLICRVPAGADKSAG